MTAENKGSDMTTGLGKNDGTGVFVFPCKMKTSYVGFVLYMHVRMVCFYSLHYCLEQEKVIYIFFLANVWEVIKFYKIDYHFKFR